jgi:ABC-type antimicrobial peptide transport system permease subunit
MQASPRGLAWQDATSARKRAQDALETLMGFFRGIAACFAGVAWIAGTPRMWARALVPVATALVLVVALSAVGIYGALAHWVSARRRELGIRIALGASGSAIAELVAGQVLMLAVIGLCIGLPLGLLGLGLLRSSLFGLAAVDAETVVEVVAFVVAGSACAAWLPAKRARILEEPLLLKEERIGGRSRWTPYD